MGDRSTSRRSAAETREHVLTVARELFYNEGIRATGVDRVAAAAAVAPTTLYRLFSSKDELVAAYLEREFRHYREWFTAAVRSGTDPRTAILAVFDALAAQVGAPDCRGCPFLIALSEFPDGDLLSHQRAMEMKEWVYAQFHTLATAFASGVPDRGVARVADQLFLLMEGVYATVPSFGPSGPADRARGMAESVLDAASSMTVNAQSAHR
ncbi:MAG: TetR/AcrR family transcriptional regulator [Mycobacteriaceae bacterium]|nr:TetR/AcrR family transcriptional regulator [Mycobacteriaceae bacterium]